MLSVVMRKFAVFIKILSRRNQEQSVPIGERESENRYCRWFSHKNRWKGRSYRLKRQSHLCTRFSRSSWGLGSGRGMGVCTEPNTRWIRGKTLKRFEQNQGCDGQIFMFIDEIHMIVEPVRLRERWTLPICLNNACRGELHWWRYHLKWISPFYRKRIMLLKDVFKVLITEPTVEDSMSI
jgi:DNA phosphorothioation-dependent restriction protein DptG